MQRLTHNPRLLSCGGESTRTNVKTEDAPKPVGPYSQAVKAGKFLFISGQIAINPKEGKIIVAGIKEQTVQVLENIRAILREADFALEDIIQTNVYLSSMTLFSDFNSQYSEYFHKDFPARVTVEARLPIDALVEISAVAYK